MGNNKPGLISDLNSLILSSGDGAAQFSSFNTTPFTEALATGTAILSDNFTLIDNFGAVIPSANITSFTMSVVNGNGTNVNSYFTLSNPTPGFFI